MTRHFEPTEIAPGLWRWTAAHPAWEPDAAPESPADWDREVGCILCLLEGCAVFIDALVPADREGFWEWADQRVETAERSTALCTIAFHRRSRDQLVARYRAATSRARDRLPSGIEPRALRGAGEVSFWLPGHRSLVFGDRIIGSGDGGLRLCPESWLGYLGSGIDLGGLRALLRPMLELPVERVLVSHGDPVLDHGRRALAAAIDAPRQPPATVQER